MGLPGAGKTRLAKQLARLLNLPLLNADQVRGDAQDWDFSYEGRLRQARRMRELADTHGASICDFVCPKPEFREIFDPTLLIYVKGGGGEFEDTDAMFVPPINAHIVIEDWQSKILIPVFTGIRHVPTPKETHEAIVSRELERLVSEIPDNRIREGIQSAIAKLELHKTYGLRFEKHLPGVIDHNGKTIPLNSPYFPFLKHIESIEGKNPEGPEHMLLECDNYVGLKYLQYTHQGLIDIIYIDPPYNTGAKDWKYNDKFVGDDDAFRHSKWLSFMEKRLLLAKTLLKETGVIFISIDDNENGALKLLCDEIFGEKNFITNFVWQKKTGGGQASHVYEGHEYIICYALKKEKIGKFTVPDRDTNRYKTKFVNGKEYAIIDDYIREVHGKYEKGKERRCHYEDLEKIKGVQKLKEVNAGLKKGNLILVPSKSDPKKNYVAKLEELSGKRKVIYSLFTHTRTAKGNEEIIKLFGKAVFPNPKPSDLIRTIIECAPKTAVVLDFFAGSGTTYQAVTELNEEDGGTRQCILMTNNENGICRDVTWERVKRVTTGTKEYPECTEKYAGNPRSHASFYSVEIHQEEELYEKTRGWKQKIEAYLPLVSTKFNTSHDWTRLDGVKGYHNGEAAIISDETAGWEAQKQLKDLEIETIAIISDDEDDYENLKRIIKKNTKVKTCIMLDRNYTEFFQDFHSK
jgi:adenine-specific DNA-methyltransferase